MLDSFFKNISNQLIEHRKQHILVDVHAHILPHLDDGGGSVAETVSLLREMKGLGYRKVIATPHVMSGYYNNSTIEIRQSLAIVREALLENGVFIELEAAAEYYLDDELLTNIQKGTPLLTLDKEQKFLLFETSFVGKTSDLLTAVSIMRKGGYTPVLAHPERYLYLQKDPESLLRLINNGVLFQLNINSLTGFYTKQAQALAEMLINRKMVAFVGTDCHNESQLTNIRIAQQLPYYEALMKQNLLNNTLLDSVNVMA